jgi:hypothetical protein
VISPDRVKFPTVSGAHGVCEVCGVPDNGSLWMSDCCPRCHGFDMPHGGMCARRLKPARPKPPKTFLPTKSGPALPAARIGSGGLRGLRDLLARAFRDLWPFVVWTEFVLHTRVVGAEVAFYVAMVPLLYVSMAYLWRALNKNSWTGERPADDDGPRDAGWGW